MLTRINFSQMRGPSISSVGYVLVVVLCLFLFAATSQVLADNTIIIFTSDNGYSLGHHGIMGKGNGTYPLNMFEESVKVPFIVRLPGVTQGGEVWCNPAPHK